MQVIIELIMKFSEEHEATHNSISSYGEGYFQIKGKRIDTSVVISARTLITDWEPKVFSELTPKHCELLIKAKPSVVILGTGKTQKFPEIKILRLFAQHQIGLEVMNTSAACRTFNILLSEDRNVVAGLLTI